MVADDNAQGRGWFALSERNLGLCGNKTGGIALYLAAQPGGFGALPRWPHSRNWGYGPSGLLGVVLPLALLDRAPI